MAIGIFVCGQLEIVERLSNWMDVIFSALEGVYLVSTLVVSSQPWWLSSFLHARYDAAFFTGDGETLQRYVSHLLCLLWLHGE